MPQNIAFNEIPLDWRNPGVYIEVRANYSSVGLLPYPARALIIGQKLAGSLGLPLVASQLTRAEQAQALFGQGSIAADMASDWLTANPTSQVSILALADAGGSTKAVGSFVISGSPTANSTQYFYVAGRRVRMTINSGDTLAIITANVLAAFAAMSGSNTLPVVATSAVAGTITLTARHGGVAANDIDLRTVLLDGDADTPGLTITVTPMSGGATNPDITPAISAIASDWYTHIVMPFNDSANMAVFNAELERRFGAMVRLDAHGFTAFKGTLGACGSFTAGMNGRLLSLIGGKNLVTPPWRWAGTLGAVAMFRLVADPGRQLRGIALPGMIGPAPADRFMDSEMDIQLRQGFSTFRVTADGAVVLERVITTYRTTPLGVPDTAWLDIMTPQVMSRIRYDWRNYLSVNYPNSKLADDGSVAAEYEDTVVTPTRMRGSWAGRSKLYERQGWIENSAVTSAASIFVRDTTDRNRMNARQQVRIIGNLMVLAAALEFQA